MGVSSSLSFADIGRALAPLQARFFLGGQS